MKGCVSCGQVIENTPRNSRQPGATKALIIITSLSLLNFVHRFIPSALKEDIQHDLHINDAESALPSTGLNIASVIFAIISGWLIDKQYIDRNISLMCSVLWWSLWATVSAFSVSLWQLILFRSLMGVATGTYYVIVPVLLADFFKTDERNMVYGIVALSIPVGAAIGFVLGASLGAMIGWRLAIVFTGIPGLVLGWSVLFINQPPRGGNDIKPEEIEDVEKKLQEENLSPPLSDFDEIILILKNPYFMIATMGFSANTFALSGLAEWMPTFLLRYTSMSIESAGLIVGASVVVGGIGGSLLGSKISQLSEPHLRSALFLIPSIFTIPAAFALLLAVNMEDVIAINAMILIANLFIWTSVAPISAVIINQMPPHQRSRAQSIESIMSTVLGDAIAPPVIGSISDAMNLRLAMQITWIAVIVSGIWWFIGYKFLPALRKNEVKLSNVTFASLFVERPVEEGEVTHESSEHEVMHRDPHVHGATVGLGGGGLVVFEVDAADGY